MMSVRSDRSRVFPRTYEKKKGLRKHARHAVTWQQAQIWLCHVHHYIEIIHGIFKQIAIFEGEEGGKEILRIRM